MSLSIESVIATGLDSSRAVADLDRRLSELTESVGELPDCVFVFYDASIDDDALTACLQDRLPGVPLCGGTSAQGLVHIGGLTEGPAIGVLAVFDADGQYGVGAAELGDDPAGAGERALQAALADADAVGELPDLVWVYQTQGSEQLVLDGLKRVVGDRCPILGGSSVDTDFAGNWRQRSTAGAIVGGVVVAALFPSGRLSWSYQGGYEPTGPSGVITEIGDGPVDDVGRRLSQHIVTIDGRPAAEVYDEWCAGSLSPQWRDSGQDLKTETATDPLGVAMTSDDGVTYFRLLHPSAVAADGRLTVFNTVRSGERVQAMRGSTAGLVRRAGQVVSTVTDATAFGGVAPVGGLVIYCAGCGLAVGDRLGEVVDTIRDGFGGVPFVGLFTAGEQGPLLGSALHSNLMISALAFGG